MVDPARSERVRTLSLHERTAGAANPLGSWRKTAQSLAFSTLARSLLPHSQDPCNGENHEATDPLSTRLFELRILSSYLLVRRLEYFDLISHGKNFQPLLVEGPSRIQSVALSHNFLLRQWAALIFGFFAPHQIVTRTLQSASTRNGCNLADLCNGIGTTVRCSEGYAG